MATYSWSVPTGKEITGATYIKDTDNNISDTINDLVEFVNGEGAHAGQGLTFDLVDKASVQTITGAKTFSSELVASGGVTGNADSATTLTNLTSTVDELNYSDGVTSNIQTQINAISTISGTYVPGASSVTNSTNPTFQTSLYSRVGDIVTASGGFSAVPSSAAYVSFHMTLPISSNFTNLGDAHGAIVGNKIDGGVITCDTTTDKIHISFYATNTDNTTFSYTLQYIVK